MTKCVVHRWLYGVANAKGEIEWQRVENIQSNVRTCSVCGFIHVAHKEWTRYVPVTEKPKAEYET